MLSKIKEKLNFRLVAIIPYVIAAAVFIIAPVILLVSKSATHNDQTSFDEILKDKTMWETLWRSIYLGLAAAFVALLLVFPFVWVVARSKNKTLRVTALSLMISPLFIFTIVKVFSLKVLMLNVIDEPTQLPENQIYLVIGMVYIYSPYMIIPLYSVIKGLPENLINASNDLGFNNFATIFKVVLPYAMKAIFAGVAMVFMLSATTLVMQHVLMSGGKAESVKMIGNTIDDAAKNILLDDYSAIRASTISLITVVVMMVVYGAIVFAPQLYRKLRGGTNV